MSQKYKVRAPGRSSVTLTIDKKNYTFRHGEEVDGLPWFKHFPSFFVKMEVADAPDKTLAAQTPEPKAPVYPLEVVHRGGGWYVVERNGEHIYPEDGCLRKAAAQKYVEENE